MVRAGLRTVLVPRKAHVECEAAIGAEKPRREVAGGCQVAQKFEYGNPDHRRGVVDEGEHRRGKQQLAQHQPSRYASHFLLPHEDPLQADGLGKDGQSVDDQQRRAGAGSAGNSGNRTSRSDKAERGQQQTQRHHARSQGRNVGAVGGLACPPHFQAAIREQEQVGEYRAGELQHAEVRHAQDSSQINKGKEARRFGNEIACGQAKDISEWARQLRAPLRLGIYHGPPEDLLTNFHTPTTNSKCYSRRTRCHSCGAHPDPGPRF